MNIKSSFLLSSFLMLTGLSLGQLSKVSGSINDIQAVNESTFIAVGDEGCIRKTTDGGKTWRLIRPVVLTNIYAITKASDLVYYACGAEGVIKSEDCGENWVYLEDPTFNWDEDIYFLDELNGYTLSGQGYVSKTNDGGETWTECARPIYLGGTGTGYFTQIYFLDKSIGYAVYTSHINMESSELYRTTNGGESWSIYREGYRYIMSPENNTFYSIKDWNVISKTSNSGKSWMEFELGIDDILNDLYFMDAQRGYAITSFGSIYYTQDGAVTWELVESYSNTLHAIASYGKSENAIAVGSHATILISNSNENDWKPKCIGPPKNLETTCSFFVSENVGFVFCKGLMFKTLDAGITWHCIQLNFDEYILDCYFVNEQIGYVFTNYALYKTQNSGLNWEKLSFYNINLNGVYFINKDTGFVYGDWGLLYKTTNGGVNWTKKAFPNDGLKGIKSMQFVNDSMGYTVGLENSLCKTIDGGETWTAKSSKSSGNSLYFLNETVGYTGTTRLLKTENGGDSWVKFDFQSISTSFIPETIKDIFFANDQIGYIVTDYYNVYRTKNGGLTWDALEYGVDHRGLTSFGAYGNTLIVVGGNGDIYKFVSDINDPEKMRTSNNKVFIECQIYPNPASDRIFLNLSLPEQKIELKLNSVNGQALLHEKIYFNGTSPIEIEIPGFYTGLAILQIIGKNFNHSEKILIQK